MTRLAWKLARVRHAPFHGALALSGARLRDTLAYRAAVATSVLLAVGASAVHWAVSDEAGPLSAFVVDAAGLIVWVAVAPVALSAARFRARADRLDGLDVLCAIRGIPAAQVETARLVAAIRTTARSAFVPLFVLVTLMAGSPGSASGLRVYVCACLAMGFFAVLVGLVVGGIAGLSSTLAGARGRTVLALLVMGPWLAMDALGRGNWSVPSGLHALLLMVVQSARTLATGGTFR